MKKHLLLSLLALSACKKEEVALVEPVVYIQIGDSITYGWANTPGNSPGDYAQRSLATPLRYVKMGWPGETARQFTERHRQQLRDSLAAIPIGRRVILGISYGANDLNAWPKAIALADVLRVARWATDTLRVPEVLLIPVMNRDDKYNYTREDDFSFTYHFNASRMWLNTELRAATATLPGVKMANEAEAARMFSEGAPADKVRFADRVHPTDIGAKELGEGTIARGLASFPAITLK